MPAEDGGGPEGSTWPGATPNQEKACILAEAEVDGSSLGIAAALANPSPIAARARAGAAPP